MSNFQTYPVLNSAQLSVHLRSLRKARGLTQTALGERIGVKQARMADIERAPGAVSLDQLLQILHALEARVQLADTRHYALMEPATPLVARSPATDW